MKGNIFIGIAISLLAGCAMTTPRGSVAMKISDREAHVCLGSGEVKVRDGITLYRNVCARSVASASKSSQNLGPRCELRRVGEGKISSIINEHYSIASFEPGVRFEEGDIVERNKS